MVRETTLIKVYLIQNNINSIRNSAENQQEFSGLYNNGVVLVFEYKFNEASKNLEIRGMSIVNGAQTTGALGTLPRLPTNQYRVQARFIKVKDGGC